ILVCLDRIANQVDALIVSDYGYDLITPPLLEKLKAIAANKKVVVDSRYRLHLFSGFTVITPNVS
ncbi:MAG: hypothetical protein GTN81_05765, partial [Proteobacteria bacterium]|nr:hypothetical protein [Pseudomonadota bacterium]